MQFAFSIAQLPAVALLGCAALVAAFLILRRLEMHREGRMRRFIDAGLTERLLSDYDLRARRPLFYLSLAGVLFLLLTLAQPHWGKRWTPITRNSRDILVLLDASLSMNAENPPPSRLERARQKIESLMERCPGDRFGLVLFAGEAAAMCPLTLDHGYFRSILDAVNTDTLSIEGTDISAALREALDVFEADSERFGDSQSDRNNRIVLLISDGEQTAGEAVDMAKHIGEHALIYSMGIGDPKGAVVEFPAWMRQYVRMPDEKLTHVSTLDEEGLSSLATASGGAYVRITPDNSDVDFIHQELEHVRGELTEDAMRFRLVNRYRWPLAAAWICFAAEGLWLALLPWIRVAKMRRREGRAHA